MGECSFIRHMCGLQYIYSEDQKNRWRRVKNKPAGWVLALNDTSAGLSLFPDIPATADSKYCVEFSYINPTRKILLDTSEHRAPLNLERTWTEFRGTLHSFPVLSFQPELDENVSDQAKANFLDDIRISTGQCQHVIFACSFETSNDSLM